MFRAPLRGLGWLCLVGIFLLGCQPAGEKGDAVKTGWIQPKHAKGFAWAESDQGQTTLVVRQPRTGKALATVSVANSRVGVDVGKDVPHVVVDRDRGFVTTSTTHVHLLEEGVGLDGWRGCNSLKYLR
ncbi:MAG: hypothetical protein VX002_01280, partial [Bacteroidota bacterium]|nr:hypothetical protein [Bacteroidota bacterium]